MMEQMKLIRSLWKRGGNSRETAEELASAALYDLKAMGAPQYVLQDSADVMLGRKNNSGVE